LIGDGVPVVLVVNGEVYRVRDTEARAMASSANSRASCSSAGRRLETGAASVSFWASIPCGTERDEGVRRRAGERGEGGGPEESGGVLNRADYRRNSTAGSLISGEQFLLAGGDVREGKRGRGGEELELYGEGFKEGVALQEGAGAPRNHGRHHRR
jgi:hypothetical protein